MMAVTPINIKEDIDGLISELIGKGVCDDSNFSAIRTFGSKADVTFSGVTSTFNLTHFSNFKLTHLS